MPTIAFRWVAASPSSPPDTARHDLARADSVTAHDRRTNGVIQSQETPPPMMRTVAHFMPFAALVGGVLILLMPRLLNYVVAIYLILVGAIGVNSIYHFIR
jgi:Protein of unknown function (DUF3096)